jgi:hypothetical protein
MNKNSIKYAELEQIVHELREQLSTMDKMLLNKEDRNAQLHIELINEKAKKRPILDANLWLGFKIGATLGFGLTTILFIILIALF